MSEANVYADIDITPEGDTFYEAEVKNKANWAILDLPTLVGADDSNIDQGDNTTTGTLAWHVAQVTKTVVVTPGTYTVSQNITIPATITLKFERGGILADDTNNADLTINGAIEAGLYQTFDWGNGTGSLTFGLLSAPVVYPHWFSVPDGSTDNAATIQQAIDSVTGADKRRVISLANSIFYIGVGNAEGAGTFTIKANVALQDGGISLLDTTGIYMTGANPSMRDITIYTNEVEVAKTNTQQIGVINLVDTYNAKILNVSIEGNISDTGAGYEDVGIGVHCRSKATDTLIKDCYFPDVGTGIQFIDNSDRDALGTTYSGTIGKHLTVESCLLGDSDKTAHGDGMSVDTPTSRFEGVKILNNVVKKTSSDSAESGIAVADVDGVIISGNYVNNADGTGGSIHVEGSEGVSITSNYLTGGDRGLSLSVNDDVVVANNHIKDMVTWLTSYNSSAGAADLEAADYRIVDNIFDGSSQLGFVVTGEAKRWDISGNTFKAFADNTSTMMQFQDDSDTGTLGGEDINIHHNFFVRGAEADVTNLITCDDEYVGAGFTIWDNITDSYTNWTNRKYQVGSHRYYEYIRNYTTIGDDGVYSFTAPGSVTHGVVVVSFSSVANDVAIVGYNTVAGGVYTALIGGGTNAEVTTGILTGTTGTDAKFTVSAHSDDKIYVENRLGGAKNVSIYFLDRNYE